jgi:hypothetical protein
MPNDHSVEQGRASVFLEVDWSGTKRWRRELLPIYYVVHGKSREIIYKRLVGRIDGPAIIRSQGARVWRTPGTSILSKKYVVFKK